MKKTALAIATATSMMFFAAPTLANETMGNASAAGTQDQGQQERSMTDSTSGQGTMGNQNTMGSQNDMGSQNTQGSMADQRSTQSFSDLDRNQDNMLDENELNTYGSTAAGTQGNDQDNLGQQNMEYYDQDRDDAVSQEEFDSRNQQQPGTPGMESGSTTGTSSMGTGSN
ncbi:MAG: hypothetical protein CL583_11600 [Alteromonadaceae bacterium]|nr:hypothetical protein [Alteromonadaceae bacterium]|tara:strand:- start:1039 stop:1548 length:510 start_codon:yes stop_codon:yes gene_type:complete